MGQGEAEKRSAPWHAAMGRSAQVSAYSERLSDPKPQVPDIKFEWYISAYANYRHVRKRQSNSKPERGTAAQEYKVYAVRYEAPGPRGILRVVPPNPTSYQRKTDVAHARAKAESAATNPSSAAAPTLRSATTNARPAFVVVVAVALCVCVPPEEVPDAGREVVLELLCDADVDDVNGSENAVEGTEVGKVSDVLVDASAQNCSEMDSAEARSPGHCSEMHATRAFAKRVELRRSVG